MATALVLSCTADLDFDTVQVAIGVNDQRSNVIADVQGHELGMLPRGVILHGTVM
jgi:hypothetical protein